MRATALIVVTCLLLATAGARAEHGRDFSALYDFDNVADVDALHVSVTLRLRLRNDSGQDLANGSIRLVDRRVPTIAVATFRDPVAIAYRSSARVTATVTVERRECQRWLRGDSPTLVVDVSDARGRHVDHPVELRRMPGIGAGP